MRFIIAISLIFTASACSKSGTQPPAVETAAPTTPTSSIAEHAREAPITNAEKPVIPSVTVFAVADQITNAGIPCELVDKMVKENIEKNIVSESELMLAFGGCNTRKKSNDPKDIVVAVKDPREKDKYFYELIPRKTAETATVACHIGSVVGANVVTAGQQDAAMILYGPGGRSCDEFLNMAINDNPMLVIDPVSAIAINEVQHVGGNILEELHIYDNYKEATAPLEDRAQTLHASVNKDINKLVQTLKDDPALAAAYASNPVITQVYKDRIRIGREVERAGKKVETAAKCVVSLGSNCD